MTTGNFTSWRELEIMSPYRPPTMTRLKHPIFVTDGGRAKPSGLFGTSTRATWQPSARISRAGERLWVFLHVFPQLRNRLRVQTQWLWSYDTGQRSSRLIRPREGEVGSAS
jgi:hypothetical protein